MIFIGCKGGFTPKEINNAEPPIVIKSLSADGIVLIDGSGIIYSYDSNLALWEDEILQSLCLIAV